MQVHPPSSGGTAPFKFQYFYYQCVACHSTAIIRQQHLTDARWEYLWTWMVKEQGMYDPEDETKDIILTYLKTHFSSER